MKKPKIFRAIALAVAFSGYTAQGATITTLASFNGPNGQFPQGSLFADSSGNLYGTTQLGGANNDGTVFKLSAVDHTISTLVTFNGTNGSAPQSALIADSAGNFYGTTFSGGTGTSGTVFKIAVGSNTLTTLATFNHTNGWNPTGLVADAAGNLYGGTDQGGTLNDGVVFKVAAGTNALSTLANLGSGNTARQIDGALYLDSAGNLYGTSVRGGQTGNGSVFKVAAGSNTLTTLATFPDGNPSYPESQLIADSSGNLYGTTILGGASNNGTVFKLSTATNTLTILASFNGAGNGKVPGYGPLIADAAGNLYGTVAGGGAASDGGVFKLAAGSNTLSLLASFAGSNGSDSVAGLIADAAGNLYGTTNSGGAHNDGTVFEVSNTGFVVPASPSISITAPTDPTRILAGTTNYSVTGTISNGASAGVSLNVGLTTSGNLTVANFTTAGSATTVAPGTSLGYTGTIANAGSALGSQSVIVTETDGSASPTSVSATSHLVVVADRIFGVNIDSLTGLGEPAASHRVMAGSNISATATVTSTGRLSSTGLHADTADYTVGSNTFKSGGVNFLGASSADNTHALNGVAFKAPAPGSNAAAINVANVSEFGATGSLVTASITNTSFFYPISAPKLYHSYGDTTNYPSLSHDVVVTGSNGAYSSTVVSPNSDNFELGIDPFSEHNPFTAYVLIDLNTDNVVGGGNHANADALAAAINAAGLAGVTASDSPSAFSGILTTYRFQANYDVVVQETNLPATTTVFDLQLDFRSVNASFAAGTTNVANITVAPVPEPSSLSLLVIGAAGLLGRRRRLAFRV